MFRAGMFNETDGLYIVTGARLGQLCESGGFCDDGLRCSNRTNTCVEVEHKCLVPAGVVSLLDIFLM